jgi:hypothetical protein
VPEVTVAREDLAGGVRLSAEGCAFEFRRPAPGAAQHLSRTGELIRIDSDPATFEGALSRAVAAG